ncbi:DUF3630 family protein [Zobellella sp. DQSA1]|uniref:DUF3630 family protein n=1 Tax=Zobellella sp. DQSA1 TaxID=3342386 RepID=UPI0035C05D68
MKTLTTDITLTMDNFPAWAEGLVRVLELELVEREEGADYHQWLVAFEGSRLLLCFQHYTDAAWLQPLGERDQDVADWLMEQWNRTR